MTVRLLPATASRRHARWKLRRERVGGVALAVGLRLDAGDDLQSLQSDLRPSTSVSVPSLRPRLDTNGPHVFPFRSPDDAAVALPSPGPFTDR